MHENTSVTGHKICIFINKLIHIFIQKLYILHSFTIEYIYMYNISTYLYLYIYCIHILYIIQLIYITSYITECNINEIFIEQLISYRKNTTNTRPSYFVSCLANVLPVYRVTGTTAAATTTVFGVFMLTECGQMTPTRYLINVKMAKHLN